MIKRKNEQGFTLVEIAIVMVIIGLLLGGALKGQEMITNAKTKRVKADFDQMVAAIYSYQDIYRALPGDNAKSKAQHGLTSNDVGGGDGLVNTEKESSLVWRDLRAAGLISGGSEDEALPRNAFSGGVGVYSNILGQNGVVLCFDTVPAASAAIIDNQYDDGAATTGSIRGGSQKANKVKDTGATAVEYTATTYGSICFGS